MAHNDPQGEEELLVTERFRVVRRREAGPKGVLCDRATIQHPGAVVILPLVDPQTVCLVRNYRVAVRQTLIELPAGTLEPGEDPLDTAYRELAEETGYRAERIEHLGQWLMSPGILNERMHVYLAVGLTAGEPDLQPDESIELLITPWRVALEMVRSGEIQDAKTVAALLFHDRFGNADRRGDADRRRDVGA
jgi:ADP-ribose pyrophosphatase